MSDDIQQTIRETVDSSRVVLFIKGTKTFPQDGFAARAIDILKQCQTDFKDVNVLTSPALQQGLKVFSNWPIVPQLYVDGKFIGDLDIVTKMFNSGDLQKLLTPDE